MRFSINIDGTLQLASELDGQGQLLSTYKNVVQSVRNNCPGSGNTKRMLQNTLNSILNEMERERNIYNSISHVLEQNVSMYRTSEKNIATCQPGSSIKWSDTVDVVVGGKEEATEDSIFSWSDLWDIVGNAGVIGKAAGAVGTIVTGDWTPENILTSSKFISDIIGDGTDIVKGGTKVSWKTLLGGEKALDGLQKGSAWKTSMNQQLVDDLGFNGAASTADKVKVGAKWAGNILTFGLNALDNYEEFEGQGTEGFIRGTKETIIETGVDIALGAAATAAVSAGLVALGVVGAPAVAVGVAAAGVTWAANAICKWATGGDDIGEVVANVVCDVEEWFTDVKKDIGEGAVNLANRELKKPVK